MIEWKNSTKILQHCIALALTIGLCSALLGQEDENKPRISHIHASVNRTAQVAYSFKPQGGFGLGFSVPLLGDRPLKILTGMDYYWTRQSADEVVITKGLLGHDVRYTLSGLRVPLRFSFGSEKIGLGFSLGPYFDIARFGTRRYFSFVLNSAGTFQPKEFKTDINLFQARVGFMFQIDQRIMRINERSFYLFARYDMNNQDLTDTDSERLINSFLSLGVSFHRLP